MAVLPLQTNMSKTVFAQVGFLRILDMLFTIIWAFKRYQVYLGTIFSGSNPMSPELYYTIGFENDSRSPRDANGDPYFEF